MKSLVEQWDFILLHESNLLAMNRNEESEGNCGSTYGLVSHTVRTLTYKQHLS